MIILSQLEINCRIHINYLIFDYKNNITLYLNNIISYKFESNNIFMMGDSVPLNLSKTKSENHEKAKELINVKENIRFESIRRNI